MADAALGAGQGPARAAVGAAAEGQVLARVGPLDLELGRASGKWRGSRLAAPLRTIRQVPAGIVDAADLGADPRQAEVTLDRALVGAATPRRSCG